MEDENNLIVGAIAVVLIVITVSISSCCSIQSYMIGTAKDPIAVACGMGLSSDACLVANGKKEQAND